MFRVDDNFPDCKKVEKLEVEHPKLLLKCLTLWLFCGCYSARNGLDGAVTDHVVRKLAPFKNAVTCADVLVEVGLWERLEDGYQYRDWADWNELKAHKQKRLRDNADRQKRFRGGTGNASRNASRNANEIVTVTQPSTSTNTSTIPIKSLKGGVKSQDCKGAELESPPPKNWKDPPVTWSSVYLCLQELCTYLGDASYQRQHLESIARQCNATKDPIGSLEQVVTLKHGETEQRGRRVEPQWLAADFDRLLHASNGQAVRTAADEFAELKTAYHAADREHDLQKGIGTKRTVAMAKAKLDELEATYFAACRERKDNGTTRRVG